MDFLKTLLTDVPRLAEIQVDWRALFFAALAGVVAATLCGLLPALQATRADLAALLSKAGRGVSGGQHKWQRALVAGQVAITVLLLAGAGFMLRSYYNLSHVDLGFDPGRAITFHVDAAWGEDRTRVAQLQKELLADFERIPGVEAAGFANFLPASGATLRYQVAFDGKERGDGNQSDDGSGKITVGERSITGGYLKALGAPMLAGQSCPELGAVANGGPKALVNRRFADLYGKNQNLVGRHIRGLEDPKGPPTEIVGVAGDMREDALNAAPVPYLYMCLEAGAWPDPEYVVRTHGDPRRLLQEIRPLVHSVDPARAVFGVKTLEQVLDQTLDQPRLNTRMLALFALVAMALAAVGLYGLVSLVVTERTREIGVRMTLGAAPLQIMAQVAAGVAPLLGGGISAGLVLTLLANRVLRSVLFGVSPTDALTLAGAVVTLAIVSALATLVPARRAAKIDPLEAIRSE